MVIYEVNITINNEIFSEYSLWLLQHIKTMLSFNGFIKAELAQEKRASEGPLDKAHLTVRYTIERQQDLDDYLEKGALTMRADGVNQFGDQFSTSRRIFEGLVILGADKKHADRLEEENLGTKHCPHDKN